MGPNVLTLLYFSVQSRRSNNTHHLYVYHRKSDRHICVWIRLLIFQSPWRSERLPLVSPVRNTDLTNSGVGLLGWQYVTRDQIAYTRVDRQLAGSYVWPRCWIHVCG